MAQVQRLGRAAAAAGAAAGAACCTAATSCTAQTSAPWESTESTMVLKSRSRMRAHACCHPRAAHLLLQAARAPRAASVRAGAAEPEWLQRPIASR